MDATNEGAIIERMVQAINPQPEQPVQEVKEVEAVPETEVEEEAKAESEAEESKQEDQDDANTEVVETQLELSQFAEILGLDESKIDIDDDGTVYAKIKVDGEEGRAKFTDLVKSYQLEGHLTKKSMELSEAKKAADAMRAEFEAQKQSQLSQIETMTRVLYQDLHNEASAIDWNELRVTDPGEYAAKVTEFQQREARLQQAAQQIESERSQAMQGQQQALREHLRNEDQKLMSAIEGWSDMTKAQKELGEIYSYLGNAYGFDQSDLVGKYDNAGNIVKPGVTDHRLVLLARKAMLYDNLQKSKPAVTKKVVTAPKIVRAGTPPSKGERELSSINKLKAQIKKSGGKDGIEAYLLRTGKV